MSSTNNHSIRSYDDEIRAEMLTAIGSSGLNQHRGISQTEQGKHLNNPGSQCSSADISETGWDADHRMSLSSGSVLLAKGNRSKPRKGKGDLRFKRTIVKRAKSKSCSSSSSSEHEISESKRAVLFGGYFGDSADDESTEFAIRKKSFVLSLMDSCSVRGYLTCKLCESNVWGPNGRYHIEKCTVIRRCRSQKEDDVLLHSINGLRIEEEFFAKPKPMKPKPAKIPGFVMSNTVLLSDCRVAPTTAQLKAGAIVGRKGYTRCLDCNTELFAPNTRRHALSCSQTWEKSCADPNRSPSGQLSFSSK